MNVPTQNVQQLLRSVGRAVGREIHAQVFLETGNFSTLQGWV